VKASLFGKAAAVPVAVVASLIGWLGGKPTDADYAVALSPERITELHQLVEQSLVARTTTLKLVRDLARRPDTPLTGSDLNTLKSGTRYYLDLRDRLYDLARAGEPLLTITDRQLARRGLTSADRLRGIMLSLGAALTLYDNYLLAAIVFEEDPRLRKLLNDPDQGFDVDANQLARVTLSANSPRKRHRLRKAIRRYEEEMTRLEQTPSTLARMQREQSFRYLHALIEGSPSYSFVKRRKIGEIVLANFEFLGRVGKDMLKGARDDGINLVSMGFGNTVGMYEARKGKLFADADVCTRLSAQLRPLDILLEKTPFRLTDSFIPGHFGHVAIWIGSERDLRELGLWEHPAVIPHHALIREEGTPGDSHRPHLIVEALRSGVQLSTLPDFLNVDDVAILRPVALADDREAIRESILLALRQVGKEYDFNFDVNTTEKIVCSELVYVAIPAIAWPTENTLGRSTISPDHVAQLAWQEDPLQLVVLYHDGKRIPEERQLGLMRSLMQTR